MEENIARRSADAKRDIITINATHNNMQPNIKKYSGYKQDNIDSLSVLRAELLYVHTSAYT